ncbi:arylamine N-acetyltransferase, pineal gland isozyme NAT-3-like isoform X1 [Alosa sapidissima]|uniref:arylamine N-acetyltransferase, pineal gland isozyme NAT-3-like isoform X1 n=1 Tax=Alosa sapidissima TaxID=34773 RepID=UPI001C082A56|nr:arylamine N-acetyltransferase, pineal gland isozyme NAT-3-like isoform X1 [Alosa sapidissima]
MDVQTYLKRIGYSGPVVPRLETLQEIHRCHMLAVPFESLTIHSGGKIKLELSWIYEKIVVERRGGFCFENNGLLSWLLAQLGFQVTILAAHVRNRFTCLYGPPFDHIVIMVTLEGHRWLCDVGFGACYELPLSLETLSPQKQVHGVFRLRHQGDMIFLESSAEAQGDGVQGEVKDTTLGGEISWTELYKFTLQPRQLEDFRNMCEYHQTSPSSLFYCKSLCSLLLPHGRITYMGHKLIVTTYPTEDGRPVVKTTQDLTDDEIPHMLKDKFDIELSSPLIPKDADIVPPSVKY